jgi:preprotein translocase subunit SecY
MGLSIHAAPQDALPGDARIRPISDTVLWRRIGFVILALLVYRLGSYITLPGIDLTAIAEYFP